MAVGDADVHAATGGLGYADAVDSVPDYFAFFGFDVVNAGNGPVEIVLQGGFLGSGYVLAGEQFLGIFVNNGCGASVGGVAYHYGCAVGGNLIVVGENYAELHVNQSLGACLVLGFVVGDLVVGVAETVFFICTGVHHFEPFIKTALGNLLCGPDGEVGGVPGGTFFLCSRVNDVLLGEVAGGVGRRPVADGRGTRCCS